AVLSAGWTVADAQAVVAGGMVAAEAVPGLLAQLVEKALVRLNNGETPRYGMQEIIRQFARTKLLAVAEFAPAMDHLLAHYAAAAEACAARDGWAGWESQRDNWRTALEWSEVAVAGTEPGLRLATALTGFWVQRGELREGREWLARLLMVATGPTALRGRALMAGAMLARAGREHARATFLAGEALGEVRAAGDRAATADVLELLGDLAFEGAEPAGAQAWLTEAVTLRRAVG